jgi:dTDP-glucose 4,6-dehydratase
MSRVVLITGGCGFIGVNFVRYWREKYPEDFIINLDKLTYAGNRESQRDLEGQDHYLFIQGDIADKEFVERLFSGKIYGCPVPELVVHFAAETHVDRSICDPEPFVLSNVVGTFYLLEAAKKFGGIRFHHVSTDEVFGDLPLKTQKIAKTIAKNRDIIDDRFTEETKYNPSSPYSASKASADHFVRAYYRTYDLPVTISNCTNNYGAYMFPEKLIPISIANVLCDRKIPLHGDGKNVREWLHVIDHCSAIDTIIFQGQPGETYMVGSGDERSNREVIDLVLSELGNGEEMIEFVEDRWGNDLRYAVDSSKLRALGWKPEWSFEEGLADMVKWYRENVSWWKPLVHERKHQGVSKVRRMQEELKENKVVDGNG